MKKRKQELRRQISASNGAAAIEKLREKVSASIIKRVLSLPVIHNSQGIAIFIATPTEVDTIFLIKTLLPHNIHVYVPKVITTAPPTLQMVQVKSLEELDSFVQNQWGISEPVITAKSIIAKPNDIDVIIVPGVAFDATCARCGHGMGFYDRYIAEVNHARGIAGKNAPTLIGLALSSQIVESVPMEEHDFHMTYVVTPTDMFAQQLEEEDCDTDNDSDEADGEEPLTPVNGCGSGSGRGSGRGGVTSYASANDVTISIPEAKQQGSLSLPHRGRRSASLPSRTEFTQRRQSTGLHNLWAELANEHQHGRSRGDMTSLSGRLSGGITRRNNSPRSPRSLLNWKERLDLVKARDFRGGWRVVTPPPDKRQREKIFNEKFGWMSKKTAKSTNKPEWHTQLRRTRVQSSSNSATSKGGRHLAVTERQSTWVSWGAGSSGVLAQGNFDDVDTPRFTRLAKHPIDIAIGGNHVVAVDRNGMSLYTWGQNEKGQLGNGSATNTSTHVPYLVGELNTQSSSTNNQEKDSEHEMMEKTSMTSTKTPASTETPKLLKWQRRFSGTKLGESLRVPSRVQRVSCGWDHTIVLAFGGHAFGWGSNSRGQLGIGDHRAAEFGGVVATPTRITIGDQDITIIGVSTGWAHSMLLCGDGSMYGCGDNKYHQLGLALITGTNTAESCVPEMTMSPRRVEWTSSQTVIEVCCGWQFSAARTHSGQVFTWGDNRKGQCARSNRTNNIKNIDMKTIPVPTVVNFGSAASTSSIVRIACGWSHMLALDQSGNVFAWGRSDMGQLGISEAASSQTQDLPEQEDDVMVLKVAMPTERKRDNKVVQIACGSEHSMAVTSGGDLYSWGWGEHGNLGHGSNTNQMVPTRVVEFGANSGCYVRDIRCGAASVFARILRTTVL